METEKSKDVNSAHDDTGIKTEGRRKFLRKASAGALIATIPAKSVWATGLTNSIVASGHGSDFANGMATHLNNVDYWRHNLNLVPNLKFKDVFGGLMIKDDTKAIFDSSFEHKTLTDVLTITIAGGHELKFRGPNNINLELIAVYLNAKYNGTNGIYFPVTGLNKPYANEHELAVNLYNIAMGRTPTMGSPSALAAELYSLNNNMV